MGVGSFQADLDENEMFRANGYDNIAKNDTPRLVKGIKYVSKVSLGGYGYNNDDGEFVAGAGSVLALKEDGTVWSFGLNEVGQLGDETRVNRSAPVQVSGLTNIVAIAAGGFHGLALNESGQVWTWGYNGDGQCGKSGGNVGSTNNYAKPILLTTISGVIGIAAGERFSIALTTGGYPYVWGGSNVGQLGLGATEIEKTPQYLTGLTGVKWVAAGSTSSHAMAVNQRNGEAIFWAWGNNNRGQLGNRTTKTARTPQLVDMLLCRYGRGWNFRCPRSLCDNDKSLGRRLKWGRFVGSTLDQLWF